MTDLIPGMRIPPPKTPRRERFRSWVLKARLIWQKSSSYVMVKKNLRMTTLQLFGALAVLVGISNYSIPCALIVGGLAAIWVAERQ